MLSTFFRLFMLAAMLLPLALPANPLKNPKRVVAGQTVNLQPLFQWWKHHSGERPLNSWVHVTGTVVGTNAWGWIVQAQVEETASKHNRRNSGASEKIILKSPPAQEYGAFLNLKAQLASLNAERSRLENVENRAKNRTKDLTPRGRRRSRGAAALARQARHVEEEAKTALKPLDNRIDAVKKQLAEFPSPDHYAIDCFALDTGRQEGKLAVYDHGLGMQ